ncbi:MAG: DUF3426 domain-containing protein [Proteobacteria bacterium]|nr:DUF3426 domain-containing protein [Pseudomonadota bacterium]
MFTQCRGCGEIFKVAVDDIVTASAMVRCSSCGAVFNALDTLSDYRPQESADLILHENDNPPPLLTHEFKQSVVQENVQSSIVESNQNQVLGFESDLESGLALEELDENVVFAVKPDFVADDAGDGPKVNRKPSLVWALLTLVLISGLLWQTNTALKNGSLQLPNGVFKQKICEQIDCFTGIQESNLNSIALVSRSIRQHPGRDNALIITTGIINSDENVQGFPALQVKMSNLNGEIVAMRRFLPREYIDDETVTLGMMPNTLIPITLELKSPGKSAVTFEVGFSPTFGAK